MIQVDALSIAYGGQCLFEKASFSIQPGERCGFVGRNGSGKSTLFKIITGKESADSGIIVIRKNYRIGILDQHIRFTQKTLLEEAALGLREEDKENIYKAERILFGLGFTAVDLDRPISDFSGGYQLRVHLAKVLIGEPDCLLLDEPTNYLDIVSITWFCRFLQQWKGELVLISHDREFMDAVTTHTMGIHRHKIKKVKGGTVAFYEQIFQEEEIHERTRQNIEKKKSQVQLFIDRFGFKASKATQAQSKRKMLDRIPTLERLKELEQLDFNFNEAVFHGKKMLEADELSFSYDKNSYLIDGLSLEVEKGERIAIVGKNGRGKSTILKMLAGELFPDGGLLKRSENVRIGYFGQTNIDRLHPKHTVEEEIAVSNPTLNTTQIKGLCGLMMFSSDKANKSVSVLSGGEKSRVLLGKIIASPCNLLLLDEPTHHLDMESIEALIDALEEFDGAVIMVTHSELILKRLVLDKIVVCRDGRQELFLGSYEEFLEKDGWHEEGGQAKAKKKGVPKDRKGSSPSTGKTLKAIDQETAMVEEGIIKLEAEQQETNSKLALASHNGDGKAIQEISQELFRRQKEIDHLFARLEALAELRIRSSE